MAYYFLSVILLIVTIASTGLSAWLTYQQIKKIREKKEDQKKTKLLLPIVMLFFGLILISLTIYTITLVNQNITLKEQNTTLINHLNEQESRKKIRYELNKQLDILKERIEDYESAVSKKGEILSERLFENTQNGVKTLIDTLQKLDYGTNIVHKAWYYNVLAYASILHASVFYFKNDINNANSWADSTLKFSTELQGAIDSIYYYGQINKIDMEANVSWLESFLYPDLRIYYYCWALAIKIINDDARNRDHKDYKKQIVKLSKDFLDKNEIKDNYFLTRVNGEANL